MNLSGKSALVTGASRGIGSGIALKLAHEGAKVAVNYRSDERAAHEIVAKIMEAGGQAFAIQGDVAKLEDIETLVAAVEREFGSLDILVNNAGWAEFAPFDKATPEHFDQQFNLNVRGLFFITQRVVPILNDGGRIVNISSVASRGLSIEAAAYGATKGAVNSLTTAFSKGLGSRGITVNAVSPGAIDTDLAASAFSPEDMERIAKGNQFGRIGQVEDIADVVAFLCSDAARWITGREIIADGGTI